MAKSRKPAKDKPVTVEEAVVIDEPNTPEADDVKDADKTVDEEVLVLEPAPDKVQPDVDVSDSDVDDTSEQAEELTDKKPNDAPAMQEPASKKSGSSFMPLLLGGAIAAGLGFGAARYPDHWPFASQPAVDPVEAKLSVITDRLTGVEDATTSQSVALKAIQEDTGLNQLRGEVGGELDQMRIQFEALSSKLADLENRVHTVEKLPQGSGMEAAAAAATAYERELQQMRQMLDTELAKISSAKDDAQTLKTSAAETAKSAAARAAMSRVLAALETGRPYGDALFDLTENAGITAPEALTAHAEKGVATLSTLQTEFPAAARTALDTSIRSAVEGGAMDRVTAFFRTQLGTRSLEPKEGSDPDAILSRAEAALKDGRINVALTELEAMPDSGKPALEAWIAQAKARDDALAAGKALATQVNSN